MGRRRRSAFTWSRCLVTSFSCSKSFFRSASHSSREAIDGCANVLVVIKMSPLILLISPALRSLFLPPIVRRHELVPFSVIAQPMRCQHPVAVALDLHHVLELRELPIAGAARTLGIERQHLFRRVQRPSVHP